MSLRNEIKLLLCAVVVAESYLLSPDKKESNTACHWRDGLVELISALDNVLKCYNEITSIDNDIFPPYYYAFIWLAKLATTLSA